MWSEWKKQHFVHYSSNVAIQFIDAVAAVIRCRTVTSALNLWGNCYRAIRVVAFVRRETLHIVQSICSDWTDRSICKITKQICSVPNTACVPTYNGCQQLSCTCLAAVCVCMCVRVCWTWHRYNVPSSAQLVYITLTDTGASVLLSKANSSSCALADMYHNMWKSFFFKLL